jgi:hypothetical protein
MFVHHERVDGASRYWKVKTSGDAVPAKEKRRWTGAPPRKEIPKGYLYLGSNFSLPVVLRGENKSAIGCIKPKPQLPYATMRRFPSEFGNAKFSRHK